MLDDDDVKYIGKEYDERVIKAIEEMEEIEETFDISDFDFIFIQED